MNLLCSEWGIEAPDRAGPDLAVGCPVVLEARVVAGSGGGPDKTILNSPRYLWSSGYRTLCAYMHPPNDAGFEEIRAKAARWQAPLLSIPDRGPLDWRIVRHCLAICREQRVRIWHGHDYKSNVLGLVLRQFWPMKLVTTVHGWVHHTRRTPLYYLIDRLCLPRYDKVICVSPDLFRAARGHGVPPSRCVLIENGVDTAEFRRRRTTDQGKARQGTAAGRLVCGAIGRLSPEKGFDLLIRATDTLLRAGHDLELWLIGEGPQRCALEQLIETLGLQARVRMFGYQADVRDVLEAMDVFVLSSLREGLPNVVLEAMALEVPVVATRIAGVPGVIHSGVNGLLIEPGSVHALAHGAAQLLEDTSARSRLAAEARKTVSQRYSFTYRMRRISALYDDLLRGSSN